MPRDTEDPNKSRNVDIAEEFEDGGFPEGQSAVDSTNGLLERPLEKPMIDGSAPEESGVPRNTESYREAYEVEFFMDAFDFDFESDQFMVPGSLNVYMEDGIVKAEYQVDKQRVKGKLFQYSNSQLDEAIGIGPVEDEHFTFNVERGQRPYLRAEAEYSEGSQAAREETIGRIENIVEILEE